MNKDCTFFRVDQGSGTLQRERVRLTEGNRTAMIKHLNWGTVFMKLDTRHVEKDIKEAVNFRVCQKQVLFSSYSIFSYIIRHLLPI